MFYRGGERRSWTSFLGLSSIYFPGSLRKILPVQYAFYVTKSPIFVFDSIFSKIRPLNSYY